MDIAAAAGLIIFFSIVAAIICGKSGSGGGALLFLAVALVTFINTPAGSGLPGATADFFQTVNEATSPALQNGGAGAGGDGQAEG